ncbi:hypothetical protein WI26_07410 [Burkholderia diffusa]|nr:hypothetical protein WI26_07410 [Burkholderia diffusa]
MTASLSDYAALVTSEHRDKPRFMATVGALVQPLVDQINVLVSMPAKFDLDNAVGVQLDDVGLWVGVSRKIRTPLTGIYFSFDIAGLGFDHGTWKGPFDPDTGLTVLDDETYRLVIRAKIGANHWDGTLESSAAILNSIFGNPSGDLMSVRANGEVFAIGDGTTKNFPLSYGGVQVRRVDSATLYRSDWQGNQQLYPTARTNIIAQSSAFDNAAWTKNLYTMVPAAISAPDGTLTGQKLADSDNTANVHTLLSPTSTALGVGGIGCASVFLQQGDRPYAVLRLQDTSNSGNYCYAVFNLSTGAVLQANAAGAGASVSAGIAYIGGGWYRCYVAGIPNPSGSGARMLIGAPLTNTNSTNYTGVAGQGIYVWGSQVEAGPVPTAYIPTTTAPVAVTDYALSSSGVAQLAVAPASGAKLSWTGGGAVYRQGTRVFIEDHQDMSMTIGIAGKVPSVVFLALLAGGYIPLKPEGVRVNYTIVTSVDAAPLFGFDVSNQYIAGFDTGAWGVPA